MRTDGGTLRTAGEPSSPKDGEAPTSPVAVVVGGTGGIGQAFCTLWLKKGGRLVFSGRDAEKVADCAQGWDRIGPDAGGDPLGVHGEVVNATDPEEVRGLLDAALALHGRLDGVVHLVGGFLFKPLHQCTDDDWRQAVERDFTSAFVVLREACRVMAMRGGGSVVLMSSAAASVGMANHEVISAVKAGVEGLARSAAATYAPRNLRINVVAPGMVRTALTEPVWGQEKGLTSATAAHPLRRLGEAADIARVIAFLLDPAQSWITGQVFGVDGGLATLRS